MKRVKGQTPPLTIKKEPVEDIGTERIDIGEFLESIGDTISPLVPQSHAPSPIIPLPHHNPPPPSERLPVPLNERPVNGLSVERMLASSKEIVPYTEKRKFDDGIMEDFPPEKKQRLQNFPLANGIGKVNTTTRPSG